MEMSPQKVVVVLVVLQPMQHHLLVEKLLETEADGVELVVVHQTRTCPAVAVELVDSPEVQVLLQDKEEKEEAKQVIGVVHPENRVTMVALVAVDQDGLMEEELQAAEAAKVF
jgi:hypothetical protein